MADQTEDVLPEEAANGTVNPPPPPPVASTRTMMAGEFVQKDNDRPQADENVVEDVDPGAAPQTPGTKGRPRTSETPNARRMREKYARQKAARQPPPDFSDLPGGKAQPAPGPNPVPTPGPSPAPNPSGSLSDEEYRASAETAVTVITGMLAMGLSKAWKVDEEEKAALTRDLAAVAKKYNWKGFSVELALCMTTGMYILSRADDPETRRKVKSVFKKILGDKDNKPRDVQSNVQQPQPTAEDVIEI